VFVSAARCGALVVTATLAFCIGCSGNDSHTANSSPAPASTTELGGTSTASSSTPPPTTSSSTATGEAIEVTVAGGAVVGGAQRKQVPLGQAVVLRVTSDVADEVHVHGYDKKADVASGGTAEISFTADIPGIFEVELENAKLKLVDLEIS
jgi:hypothetical protein